MDSGPSEVGGSQANPAVNLKAGWGAYGASQVAKTAMPAFKKSF